MSAPDCWCEWVDTGVGEQRVTDNPECPEHSSQFDALPTPECPECGQDVIRECQLRCCQYCGCECSCAEPCGYNPAAGPGPNCDWDSACPQHGDGRHVL